MQNYCMDTKAWKAWLLPGGLWWYGMCPASVFLLWKGRFWYEIEGKMRFFEKKTPKCFAVKKKALPLHSLYDSNGTQIDAASLAQLARARDL